MAAVVGVIPNLARANLAYYMGALAPSSPYTGLLPISSFKVGLGGWINPGGGPVPRTPDPTLTDLDIIINPGRYPGIPPGEGSAYFQKALPGSAFSASLNVSTGVDSILNVQCLLDFPDFNSAPGQIWELGLYDSNGTMSFYGTFVGEQKSASVQLLNQVQLYL